MPTSEFSYRIYRLGIAKGEYDGPPTEDLLLPENQSWILGRDPLLGSLGFGGVAGVPGTMFCIARGAGAASVQIDT